MKHDNCTTPQASPVPEGDIFPTICIVNNLYGKMVDNGNSPPYFKPYGRAVWVLEVFVEIESGNEWLYLEFVTDTTTNLTKKVEIPRALLNTQGVSQLCELGIDAQQHNATVLFQLIQKQEMALPKTFRHTHIGWAFDQNNNLFFKGKSIIGGINSTYTGKKNIGNNGSYRLWKEMVLEEVIGKASLELAVIIGLSATLVGYMNMYEPTDSLLVHLCGDSSTGKTTAASLATSVAGKPSFAGNTLMSAFQATKNAITRNVANNYGVPQVFDELSMFSGNLTELIYTLASGKEKDRLDMNSALRTSENWSTTIITTGEKNLLTGAKQNSGLDIRVFVFDSINWTNDADHAERIASVISENYGFATLELAEFLMNYDIERMYKKLKHWRRRYEEETSIHNSFTARVAKKYSILLVTARIAKEALGLNFNANRILKLILKNEANYDIERDLGLKAYELFLEFVETSHSFFGFKSRGDWLSVRSNQNYGVVERLATPETFNGISYSEHIIIAKTKFISFCSQYGFEDPNIVLKNWKAKGLLKSEKDRLVCDKKISSTGNAVKCYIVRVSSERTAQDSFKPQYTRTSGKAGEVDICL